METFEIQTPRNFSLVITSPSTSIYIAYIKQITFAPFEVKIPFLNHQSSLD